jgi:hypothetical protein
VAQTWERLTFSNMLSASAASSAGVRPRRSADLRRALTVPRVLR